MNTQNVSLRSLSMVKIFVTKVTFVFIQSFMNNIDVYNKGNIIGKGFVTLITFVICNL